MAHLYTLTISQKAFRGLDVYGRALNSGNCILFFLSKSEAIKTAEYLMKLPSIGCVSVRRDDNVMVVEYYLGYRDDE